MEIPVFSSLFQRFSIDFPLDKSRFRSNKGPHRLTDRPRGRRATPLCQRELFGLLRCLWRVPSVAEEGARIPLNALYVYMILGIV